METNTRAVYCRRFCLLNLLLLAVCGGFLWLSDRYAAESCVWAATLHIYCPGCGGSRAFFALMQGRLWQSFAYHPAVLLGGLLLLYYEVRGICTLLTGDAVRFFGRVRHRLLIAYAVCIVVFAVVRNLLLFAGIDLIGDLGGFYR